MKPELSAKAQKFRRNISPVREIMSYADPGYLDKLGIKIQDLISFAGGWVNHHAPEDLRKCYQEISSDVELFHLSGGYSPTLGFPAAKEAVISFERYLYGINDLTARQVVIGHSSTQLAMDVFQVLLDEGDQILMLDPSYCNYPTQLFTAINHIRLIRFPAMDFDAWKYDIEERIDSFCDYIVEKKPKIILLIIPDNPSSYILSDQFISRTLEIACDTGSMLVIDFAYKELTFNSPLPAYYSWSPSPNFMSLHSNSKWGRGLGRRMGWIEAPEVIVEALESIMNSSILCPDSLHQMAFINYVNDAVSSNKLKDYVSETSKKYEAAAKVLCQSIDNELKLPYLKPFGGLYTIINVGMNSAEFTEKLLKEKAVLVVPGWGFGPSLSQAIRLSYGPLVDSPEKIDEGIRRIAQFNNKIVSHD